MQINLFYILIAILILSIRSYILMVIDKRRAIKGKWRISERQLFVSALILGSFGIWFGMLPPVNHKKSKTSFILIISIITIAQLGVTYWLFQNQANTFYYKQPF